MSKQYGNFKIGELFSSINGDTDLKKDDLTNEGIPLITSGLDNNGVAGLTNKPARIIKGNSITVDMFGNVFYREYSYKMVTHARVFALLPTFVEMNEKTGLYFVSALKWLSKMFNYNNMCSYAKIKDLYICLPLVDGTTDQIDWDYMAKHISELEAERISELEAERISELEAHLIATGLNDYELTEEDKETLASAVNGEVALPSSTSGSCLKKWERKFKEFKIEELFAVEKVTKKITKSDLEANGCYPCYSSDSSNGGILGYTNNSEFHISDDKKVFVIFGDHTRTFNIATKSFSVLDNVKVLIPTTNNIEAILYMVTMWKKQIPNQGYARHWSLAKHAILELPVDTEGKPDFVYMEKYIKAIEKTVIADVVKYKNKVINETKKIVLKTD